jgi:cytidyltransferase-like protein
MHSEVKQHAILISDLIQQTARRLGFTEPSIAAKVAKHERGALEHHEDLLLLDAIPEISHEVNDLHNYLVTHAAQHGFYPGVEVCLRLVELLERRLGKLRPGVPAHSVIPLPHISPRDNAALVAFAWALRGEAIVLTNGCFDILHRGHTSFLTGAKEYVSDQTGLDVERVRLVVAVNSDASVRQLKGPDRPYNLEADRRDAVASLKGWIWLLCLTRCGQILHRRDQRQVTEDGGRGG